jgi:S-DNA-T family DNA segregation ATPase FtsK/SpoIIIE
MARKKEEKSNGAKKFGKTLKNAVLLTHLKHETRRSIGAIVFFTFGLLLLLASHKKTETDLGGAGVAGSYLFNAFSYLLGIGYFLLPALCFILAISLGSEKKEEEESGHRGVGGTLFFLGGLAGLGLVVPEKSGAVGRLLASPLIYFFGDVASYVVVAAVLIISFLIIFELPLGLNRISLTQIIHTVRQLFTRKQKDGVSLVVDESKDLEAVVTKAVEEITSKEQVPMQESAPEEEQFEQTGEVHEGFTSQNSESLGAPLFPFQATSFNPPPVSLLEVDRGKPGVGDIKANANIIKRTLQNFGIAVEMDEISIGPTVTRYAMKPAEGVRLQKIVALQQNLELALAAYPVRIEAPIPGKSLVGIEVPNSTKSIVGLGSMLNSPEFTQSDKPLLMALGRGITGKSYFGNLAKMPHLLIAGTTGSGKSVMIHTLITSLLYRNSPDNLRFIMIDPKRVELTLYNGVPHLLNPVITDAKKTIAALKWAAKEMDRRYDILEGESVRDIDSYHKNVLAPALETIKRKGGLEEGAKAPEMMPYICIFIDELADIMQAYPRELEAAIVRLAQMSRAVGIHLILSTQRPSVNVITGLIKANIPGRIALQVASQIDSRTILDMGGAEKLLGAGDMLYLSSDMAQPQRVQSPYVTETELKKVVKYLIKEGEHIPPSEINLNPGAGSENGGLFASALEDGEGDVDDDLYEEAREVVMKAGKASTSYLQRRLKVGYARAARIMDVLEEKGVIGPADGSKPRDVLIKSEGDGFPPQEDAELL